MNASSKRLLDPDPSANKAFLDHFLQEKNMAKIHLRSNSLPSKPHPLMEDVEDHLYRLKASQDMSTSATSVCLNLDMLRDSHEAMSSLIQIPSTQQALSHGLDGSWANEVLEGSLGLVDLCGVARDIVCLAKESVQDLESAVRRNRGERITENDINAYLSSRKKIRKMAGKCIKSFNSSSTPLPDNNDDLKAISRVLKEMEATSFSVLKSVFILVSEAKTRSKQRSWLSFSKFSQTIPLPDDEDQENGFCDLDIASLRKGTDKSSMKKVMKQLKSSEAAVQNLEEGLESFFRCLIRTRVSLLNALSH